jgi:hypothetical protein
LPDAIDPIIITSAVKIITCIIKEVFTNDTASDDAIDKKRSIVIRPLGATNNKGDNGSFKALRKMPRKRKNRSRYTQRPY